MFKDTKEGTTHYQNDGCGEPAHNDPMNKEQLKEMDWFQVSKIEDLPEAKRKETFISFASRNNYKSLDDAKLDYLIYKHELNM